jgi:hypothetical protein
VSPTTDPLFVVGCPRSGTTLLAGLLSGLPDVWIGKETNFIPPLYEPDSGSLHEWGDARLGALVDAVNSYLETGRWEARATVAGARRAWSETGMDTQTNAYAGFIRYVWSLDAPPDGEARPIAGDQSPAYVLALPLLEQLFPTARYIHVLRDPRDVVASILPLPFWSRSAGVAASDWNECVAGWWAAERRVPPERRCEVRYEDLVRDPDTTLRQLATTLDLTLPDPEPGSSLSKDRHGLADLAPHHARLSGPIDDSSVGRHRRDLTDRDRSLVEAITYAGLVTYGYETGPYRPSPVLQEDVTLLTRERLRDLRRRAAGRLARRWPW